MKTDELMSLKGFDVSMKVRKTGCVIIITVSALRELQSGICFYPSDVNRDYYKYIKQMGMAQKSEKRKEYVRQQSIITSHQSQTCR